MNEALAQQIDAGLAAHLERERDWLPHDRRGRWLVIEPGPGHLLHDQPRWMRDLVDAVSERRARRFSSLSRARAFARRVGGTLAHWRRTPPSGGQWRRVSPWDRAIRRVGAYLPRSTFSPAGDRR